MADRKNLSADWPSSASYFDGKVYADLNLQNVSDPVQVTMTPMQAMELGLQLINRSRDCLKQIVGG